MPTISYAITAHNEHAELEKLLDQINSYIAEEDEVVLQLDSSATPQVKLVAEKYNVGTAYEYHRIICPLDNDFASFKNNLKNHCTRDYIIFIDADELLGTALAPLLKQILADNPEAECYAIPRVNTVEGLTEQHIQKWGWSVDENGWVNYPDYQTRICKNSPNIKWSGKVHERLVGWKIGAHLPAEDPDYGLMHHKTIQRQEQQNNFYNTI